MGSKAKTIKYCFCRSETAQSKAVKERVYRATRSAYATVEGLSNPTSATKKKNRHPIGCLFFFLLSKRDFELPPRPPAAALRRRREWVSKRKRLTIVFALRYPTKQGVGRAECKRSVEAIDDDYATGEGKSRKRQKSHLRNKKIPRTCSEDIFLLLHSSLFTLHFSLPARNFFWR